MLSIPHLLILLVVVVLLFGTKKLRNLGGDLGSAIKSFKSAMNEGEKDDAQAPRVNQEAQDSGRVIEGEVERDQVRK